MAQICKLMAWDTELYADCVEFCPIESYSHILLCGTYQLSEGTSTRLGRLSVHNIDPNNLDINPIQLVESPGILDIKWCCEELQEKVVAAVVNAKGELVLYELKLDNSVLPYHTATIGSNSLALSCDWNKNEKISISDSQGLLTCFCLTNNGTELLNSWKCHDYEAWITCFDVYSQHLVYSGGDDCYFRLWDLRSVPEKPILANKDHEMGVTSILPSKNNENLLATGSYDERLLLWDKRLMKRCMSETRLGGGVWKLKWKPDGSHYLLAATMHNGFHIVDCNPNGGPCIVASYKEHSSLAYGCDWSRLRSADKLIATCSFYDHALHLSIWNSP